MRALIRAELLRLRKRRTLQVIVLGVPVVVGLLFIMNFTSIQSLPPFDEAATRQELIDMGYVVGLPPEEAERLLDETVGQWRQSHEQAQRELELQRASFAFPYSIVKVLTNGPFVFAALLLLTATTLGDDLGWGTVRTNLLASGNRRRVLAARLTCIAAAGSLMFALLLLVGSLLPFLINVTGSGLPAELPPLDVGALLFLLVGELLAAFAVMGFAALATLVFRSGPLALVALPVWFAVEAAILVTLLRFPNFSGRQGPDGNWIPGQDAWLLEAFPLRGLTTLIDTAARAASGLPRYLGEPMPGDLTLAMPVTVTFAALAVVLLAAGFRRFQRMDIVE